MGKASKAKKEKKAPQPQANDVNAVIKVIQKKLNGEFDPKKETPAFDLDSKTTPATAKAIRAHFMQEGMAVAVIKKMEQDHPWPMGFQEDEKVLYSFIFAPAHTQGEAALLMMTEDFLRANKTLGSKLCFEIMVPQVNHSQGPRFFVRRGSIILDKKENRVIVEGSVSLDISSIKPVNVEMMERTLQEAQAFIDNIPAPMPKKEKKLPKKIASPNVVGPIGTQEEDEDDWMESPEPTPTPKKEKKLPKTTTVKTTRGQLGEQSTLITD